jgi:hypothetical protein
MEDMDQDASEDIGCGPALLISCTISFLIVSLFAACAAPRTSSTAISGEDDSPGGSVQISHALGGSEEAATSYGLRVEIDGGGGDIVEALVGGQFVRLKDVDLAGPGDVRLDFDHQFVGISFYGSRPLNGFELEGELGFGRSTLDARASLGALSESAEFQGSGFYVGGSVAYPMDWPALLFYRVRGFQFSAGGDASIWEAQLGASWSVNQTMAVSAGMRGWNYVLEPSGGTPPSSDLDLTLNGPFLRFEFSF